MQQSTAPWYLFNFSIKEVNCTDVALGYSLLEATSKGLSKKKALLNCWDGFWIQGFGNAYNIRIIARLDSLTHQAKPLEKLKGMKKDRTILRRLGLMIQPDNIWLDGLTWWII